MMWQNLLKGKTLVEDLKETLLMWEMKNYPSDEVRWKSYAEDIAALVEKWEGSDEWDVEWKATGAVTSSTGGIATLPLFSQRKRKKKKGEDK